MSAGTMMVGAKSAEAFPPFAPVNDADLVGRDAEARLVLAAWICQPGFVPMAPLLVGAPGVGKNRLVYELARITAKPLYVLQGHDDVTPEDLVCAVRFSDDPSKKMDYVLSALATAMLKGGICFIDEIGKLRPRALAPLASVLDDRRYLDSVLLGERIHAHPGFRFIAATNSADLAQDALPEFIRSRLRPVIEIGFPAREEIGRIVRGRFRRLVDSDDGLIEGFWRLWSEHRGEEPPSPRDTLYLFGLALNLADAEAASGRWSDEPAAAAPVPPQQRHVEAAFRQLFVERDDSDGRDAD